MKRNEIQNKYKWDLSAMVDSADKFEKLFAEIENSLSVIEGYKGKLGNKADALACLKLEAEIGDKLELIYVYSHMYKDEDATNNEAVALAARTDMLAGKTAAATSFIVSELSALDKSVLDGYIKDAAFAEFDFSLKEIVRQNEHILSDKEEKLLALAAEALDTPYRVAHMMFDVDMKFAPVKRGKKKIELTNGSYGELLADPDREVRKQAFDNLYDGYIANINTIAANYAGNVKADNFVARARGFNDCLEQSLFGDNVPTSVYENLIAAVNKNFAPLHRYIALRKKLLGVDEQHMYDLYTPIVSNAEMKLSYEQACEIVKAALAPMGDEYVGLLNKAMTEGWIDVMQCDGKRGGAYSWSAYCAHPYVLLNYAPTTEDIFTLAHELGHCLHSYYSQKNQPYSKWNYQIFVAEVASISNETLLDDYLMKNVKDDNIKKYLLSLRLNRFRTTLFRQAMFAEFEYKAHKMDLEGKPLTVDALCETYLDLNKKYYGKDVVSDDRIAYEWARIPHFYKAFYVYKYSTGMTAATSVAHNVLARPEYVDIYKTKFLSAGGHKSPYEILCDAEVDLATEKPYDDAFAFFNSALDELEKLCK
ncbi:MAG: oligoendopeptidase F [Clostridiales bacterium]|nr:oligoendopeptidase F [Clostridiales bacterium]